MGVASYTSTPRLLEKPPPFAAPWQEPVQGSPPGWAGAHAAGRSWGAWQGTVPGMWLLHLSGSRTVGAGEEGHF